MTIKFNDLVEEVRYIYKQGKPSGDTNHLGGCKEIILQGSKARGAGYRLRKELKEDYTIINMTDTRQTIPASEKPIILYLDLRNFDGIPESFRELAKARDDVKIMAIDSKDEVNGLELFTYSLKADYYLNSSQKDIDPSISRQIAELYVNVENAVDKEGIEHKGKLVKPYFHTSFLIDWPRSRDILEGSISSVIRKFNPDVIASRETIGIPPEDVRMYELAKPLAERLGIKAVKIEKANGSYYIDGNIRNKRVLLLEDVVGDGSTKLKIIDRIKKAEGFIKSCVVLMDRKEGGLEKLSQEGVELYALTDIDQFNALVSE